MCNAPSGRSVVAHCVAPTIRYGESYYTTLVPDPTNAGNYLPVTMAQSKGDGVFTVVAVTDCQPTLARRGRKALVNVNMEALKRRLRSWSPGGYVATALSCWYRQVLTSAARVSVWQLPGPYHANTSGGDRKRGTCPPFHCAPLLVPFTLPRCQLLAATAVGLTLVARGGTRRGEAVQA